MEPIERLPDQAQTKFELVRMEAIDARDAATHLAKQLKEVEGAMVGTDPSAADKTRESLLRDRLKQAQGRDFTMRNLIGNVNLFINRLAANQAISVSMFDKRGLPKRKRSADPKEALEAVRTEIEEAKNAIAAIERAPIAGKSKRAAVKRYLATLVANGTPKANVNQNGEVSIRLGIGPDSVALFDAKGSRLLGMVMHLVGEEKVRSPRSFWQHWSPTMSSTASSLGWMNPPVAAQDVCFTTRSGFSRMAMLASSSKGR
jgi:hypothetical protein